jgi:hypothetical protein
MGDSWCKWVILKQTEHIYLQNVKHSRKILWYIIKKVSDIMAKKKSTYIKRIIREDMKKGD